MLALERGLGFLVNASYLASQLRAEATYNANDFGFTVLTGRSTPPPAAAAGAVSADAGVEPASPRLAAAAHAVTRRGPLRVDTVDDVDWMGAAPTWSYLALAVGQGAVDDSLAPTRASVENWRTRLADWWNLAGITTSGDWGGQHANGMPYVTSHYGFLLPDYHLLYALAGQATDLPGGTLSFAPRYACPYTLPLLLAGTTGAVACDGAGQYSVSVAFGSLSLPAGGLSVSGSPYPGAVALSAGGSVSW